MEVSGSGDLPAPACDVCGLELEFIAIDIDGHPAVRLSCLLHGERGTWLPFAEG